MPQDPPLHLLRATEDVRVFDHDVSNTAVAETNWCLVKLDMDGYANGRNSFI